ncbi:Heat shock transcription factor [Coemansia brasiliensis]|uniref:Heat shock transcription factor n=1 Tax=Coemansia brasiliensis TaxID=2650707 RepID=A0A9W8IE85_9FUNG|nr:Heat shock transcription factor [Coemansia brasiliensis]
MSEYTQHSSGRTVARPADSGGVDAKPVSGDYRTSIHFLTSPSSATTAVGDEPSSVPVSALLAPKEDGRRNPVSLPPIHISNGAARYGEDELTGMAGLMELSAAKAAAHSMGSEAYSSSTSSTSTAPRSVPQHGAMLTPPYTAQQSEGTRSFPVIDDAQGVRKRSQSTDTMHGALPYVLTNANIRNRAQSTAQRQRTSDTPLFPVLLHRIISDPRNSSWIRWCDDGRAFKFSSADNLLACLQAAGLRAQNYHSVEKNLNDYRFARLTDQRRKIPDIHGKLWWMFSHPQFLRDHPDGIVNIQRRRRTNPPPVSPPGAYALSPPPGPDAWM